MKVEQYKHANQFHIYGDGNHYLQSYNSLVVKVDGERNTNVVSPYGYIKVITLGFNWDYSLTTLRHVYDFLEEYGNISFDGITNKKQYINKLIEDGTINYDWSMQ